MANKQVLGIAKRKRRIGKIKKWSQSDRLKIIEFLEDERSFECPTAQVYYRKLLEAKKIDATWELVKWKVRNMKTSLKKAEEFRISNDAGLSNLGMGVAGINDKLNKICPNYERLANIFSVNPNILIKPELIDSEASSAKDNISEVIIDEVIGHEISMCQLDCTTIEEKRLEMQKKELVFKEKQLMFEQEKANFEFRLEERALDLKERELDLKFREIEKDERLRILELEKNERIDKFEIEMKYKMI